VPALSGTAFFLPHRIFPQLFGFAKRDVLAYFAEKLCGVGYQHEPRLAPTKEMLNGYKKNNGNWSLNT
jgi:hypothetical protein